MRWQSTLTLHVPSDYESWSSTDLRTCPGVWIPEQPGASRLNARGGDDHDVETQPRSLQSTTVGQLTSMLRRPF